MNSIFFKVIKCLLSLFAQLPLQIIHGIGAGLGWLVYIASKKYARTMQENLLNSKLTSDEITYKNTLNQNIAESGKALLETFAIWLRKDADLLPWVKSCYGWSKVEEAGKLGKGIIFLTPHLGCFEITSIYYGQHYPITVLYRPPRQSWLMPLISQGRQRGKVSLAPANSQGVKQLLQALKRGEAIGILPDQAPLEGEGEWAPFFGKDAYTMTLASKLAQKSGAQVFMAFGERLPYGKGYSIHIQEVPTEHVATPSALNAQLERTISLCPTQYLWAYNRYKVRK